jgi:ribosomal protein L37AE/L43A
MSTIQSRKDSPDADTLKGFLKSGKTIDWISERWNVKPQTVRAWLSKFNIHLPQKTNVKTSYTRRKPEIKQKNCPVCQSHNVNYLLTEKHWYCLNCDTEFDKNNVIYVYDDRGELVEVITHKTGIWEHVKLNKAGKGLIRTVTV